MSDTSPQTSPGDDLEVIYEWNAVVQPAVEECFHHVFESWVEQIPNDEAIRARDDSLTYRELDKYASKLAYRLLEHGIRAESLVPICFEQSMWAIVSMLAILKAGGAIVPITASPRQRTEMLLKQMDSPGIILASAQQATALTELSSDVWVVSREELDSINPVGSETLVIKADVRPDNLAFVIFTSGSTGPPKGAQLEHMQICSWLKGWPQFLRQGRGKRQSNLCSYVFSGAVIEIVMALGTGSTLCVPSEWDRLNNAAATLKEMDVTHAIIVPALLGSMSPEDCNLEVIQTGSESVPSQTIRKWSAPGTFRFIYAYGPTEAVAVASVLEGTPNLTVEGNIGRAVTSAIWIIDPEDPEKLCPVGTLGEILLEGSTVGRGYYKDKDRSEAVFIKTPSWLQRLNRGTSYRLFKTGDLGMFQSDGTIVLKGRKDQQVKIAGQKVGLLDVETHLRPLFQDGTQVVVETRTSTSGDQTLVAFVTFDAGSGPMVDPTNGAGSAKTTEGQRLLNNRVPDLRRKLQKILPPYMIPSAFIFIDTMPRLMSRKIDRISLRRIAKETSISHLISNGERKPPSTVMEKRMSPIWADALDIEPSDIDVDDDFFLLGGDSSKAIRLVTLSRGLGVGLTVGMIFSHPTLAGLATVVESNADLYHADVVPFSLVPTGSREQLQREAAATCKVNVEDIEDIYPNIGLEVMYMETSEIPVKGIYNLEFVFELPSSVDTERYLKCWDDIIAAHDNFRTRIVKVSSRTYKVVLKHGLEAIRTSDSLESHRAHEKTLKMGYGEPLSRYAMINDSRQDKRYFFWTAKHATFDEWTVDLLLEKLTRAYNGQAVLNETLNASQIASYKIQLDFQDAEAYFRTYYNGADFQPLFHVPQGHFCIADQKAERRVTPKGTVQGGLTLSTLLGISLALVLSRQTQQTDISLGTVRTGRTLPIRGIEDFLGCAIVRMPMRVSIHEDSSLHDTLHRYQKAWAETSAYESLSLAQLQKISHPAVVNHVMLNIHPPAAEARPHGPDETRLPRPSTALLAGLPCPLWCDFTLEPSGAFAAAFHYDHHVISREVVASLLQGVEDAVQQLLNAGAGPDQKLRDIKTRF